MTARVGALLRKSKVVRDGDRALSIETQDARFRDWAVRTGHAVDESQIYRENVSGWVTDYAASDSAKLAKRDGLAAALAAMEQGAIDALAVVSVDRLSRSGAGHVMGLIDQGYRFYFITEGWDSADSASRGFIALFAEMARKHSDDKSEVLRHVKAEGRERGYWSARPPWGFLLVGQRQAKRLTPDPALWPHVERVFADVADGRSLREVADALNADGIPSPTGQRWQRTVVRRVILNPAYSGWQVIRESKGGIPSRYLGRDGRPVRVLPEGVGIPDDVAAKAQAVMTGARTIMGQNTRPKRRPQNSAPLATRGMSYSLTWIGSLHAMSGRASSMTQAIGSSDSEVGSDRRERRILPGCAS